MSMEERREAEARPQFCPYCGAWEIDSAGETLGVKADGDYFIITEFQCHTCGAAFWCA